MVDLLIIVLAAIAILSAFAFVALWVADSGALNTEVRCHTCYRPIRLKTEEEQAAYLRGLAVGHDYCLEHAPTIEDAYPECARNGCSKTWDGKRYVCGTCGRALALAVQEWTA